MQADRWGVYVVATPTAAASWIDEPLLASLTGNAVRSIARRADEARTTW
ncbi:hypothetical protein [Catellatospora tritici]